MDQYHDSLNGGWHDLAKQVFEGSHTSIPIPSHIPIDVEIPPSTEGIVNSLKEVSGATKDIITTNMFKGMWNYVVNLSGLDVGLGLSAAEALASIAHVSTANSSGVAPTNPIVPPTPPIPPISPIPPIDNEEAEDDNEWAGMNFNENYEIEDDIENRRFNTWAGHFEYRITFEMGIGEARQMDHEKLKYWLSSDLEINNINDVPCLSSLLDYLRINFIPDVKNETLKAKMEKMLTSEEGSLELLRYIPTVLFINGKEKEALKIEKTRAILIEQDPTLLGKNISKLKAKNRSYFKRASQISDKLSQNLVVPLEDKEFFNFYILTRELVSNSEAYTNVGRSSLALALFKNNLFLK